jgi:perosamine synthetase
MNTTVFSKTRLLPRSPVLDWSSFSPMGRSSIASIERLPNRAFTTSGRGAIYHALKQLRLPAGATVLVPSYHCPTMVAPVLLANLKVAYYGLRADGLPKLDTIDAATASAAGAILVPHLFGLAKSLAEVRAWCDAAGVALIEDCAHCYFGAAGDRSVGAWGDFSTASLSKFFPVPEAGLLASATRPIAPLALSTPTWKAQLKGLVDVFERAVTHQRLAGVNTVLGLLFKWKNSRRQATAQPAEPEGSASAQTLMRDCDMDRIEEAPLFASMVIRATLPRSRIVAKRRENYALYAACLSGLDGARPLFGASPDAAAPYVFPLWVDDPNRVYKALREQELPVFRWDRIWLGVPALPGDVGPRWSHHVLQLLCHQDLDEQDIRRTAAAIVALLQTPDGASAAAAVPNP